MAFPTAPRFMVADNGTILPGSVANFADLLGGVDWTLTNDPLNPNQINIEGLAGAAGGFGEAQQDEVLRVRAGGVNLTDPVSGVLYKLASESLLVNLPMWANTPLVSSVLFGVYVELGTDIGVGAYDFALKPAIISGSDIPEVTIPGITVDVSTNDIYQSFWQVNGSIYVLDPSSAQFGVAAVTNAFPFAGGAAQGDILFQGSGFFYDQASL